MCIRMNAVAINILHQRQIFFFDSFLRDLSPNRENRFSRSNFPVQISSFAPLERTVLTTATPFSDDAAYVTLYCRTPGRLVVLVSIGNIAYT